MEAGSALVQASLEHLQTAERSWDKWVAENAVVLKKFPTEVQVLAYMSQMSRSRQRECLAQRGMRRAGGQKGSVRNYVAEMGNNLWPRKYSAFAKLEPLEQKQYWSTIFTAYSAMYASASQAVSTEEDEERAEQLVAQTEEVYKRKHVNRHGGVPDSRPFHQREDAREQGSRWARGGGDHSPEHGGARRHVHQDAARQ